MKKTYISPSTLTVTLSGRDTLLQAVSANNSLLGTSFGGNTEDENIINSDTKELFGKNIWDNEW